MNEPIYKPEKNPESYSPKKPIIASMIELSIDNKINGKEIPFLFKKQIIHLPKSVLVGKKVTYPTAKQGIKEEDGGNPPLNLLWKKCEIDGTFDYLDKQKDLMLLEAYLGLYFDININGDGNFSYLVGALMKSDTVIPNGFAFHEMPESDTALCWFKFKPEEDIWSIDPHNVVNMYLEEQNYMSIPSESGGWCSELYPNDVHPDKDGYNILGYLIACQKNK